MIRHLVLGLFVFGVVFNSKAQNFEWSKVYGWIQSDNLRNLCKAGSGDYSFAYISTSDNINFKQATIKLNSLSLSKNQMLSDCIIKFDTAGNVVWAKQIFEPKSIASNSMISDINDNVYILGSIDRLSDSVRFDQSKSYIKLLTGEFSKTFLIKLDSSGNFIWQKEFSNVMNRTNSLNLIDGNIYLSLQKNSKSKFFISGNDTIEDNGIIIKLDSLGMKIYTKGIGTSKNYDTNGEVFKVKDTVVLFLRVFYSNYKINNDSIELKYSKKGLGHLIKVSLNETNNKSKINQITSDGGTEFTLNAISKINDRQFALAGSFKDSLPFKNYKKIIYPNNNLSNTALIIKDNGVKSHFNLQYSPNMSGGQFLICSSKGQFIYVGGTAIGNFEINGTKTKREDGLNVFCKLDTLCNPLWLFRTGDSTASFNPSGFSFDNFKGVYFGTTFSKSIKLGGSVYNSNGYNNDFIISKVFDYSITRGHVSKGPYCAGDSILIPYSKEGKFDTSNIFIAHLSDENGEFEATYRELGRLKSNSDGLIKGVLPLFEIESSAKYRIRIVSTKPKVQSYYRLDSLRLLIYSKDTANVGRDTLICPGQIVQLNTSGGSRWRWSPGHLVSDSTAKRPIAISSKTTTYRVIISDSSGCGKIDTAYKTINIAPPLLITNLPKDTIVCKGNRIHLKIVASGGLGKGYTYQWLSNFNKPLGNNDSISTIISSKGYMKVILNDGCSLADTATINFSLPVFAFQQLLRNKEVCRNSSTLLKIEPSKGIKQDYNYQWLTPKNVLLGNTDTLTYKAATEGSLKIVLTYKCSGLSDTSFVRISFPVFKFDQLLHDTLVCKNSEPILQLIPSTGLKSDFSFQWLTLNNQVLRNTDTMTFKISKPESLKAILTYNCSGKSDTSKIHFSIPTPITSQIEKPLCFDSTVTLQVNSSGGYKNSLNNIWLRNNKATDIGKRVTFSITKKETIKVFTTDACNFLSKDSIVLIPNPKANLDILADSICLNSPVHVINKSQYFVPITTRLKWVSNKVIWKTNDTSVIFSSLGKQIVSILIEDSIGCIDSAAGSIFIVEKPNADFVTNPTDLTVDISSFSFVPIQKNNKSYYWVIGDILNLNYKTWQIVRIPIYDTITYPTSLIVANSFGCRDTVMKNIKIGLSDAFWIPNAVSRNDDGLNDEFAPYGWKIRDYDMLIVSRSKQVVFKGSTPWKPEFEDGVYSYVMNVRFKDGTEKTYNGLVYVIH